jgi:transcriptional regulator with XRE-family HTH domain
MNEDRTFADWLRERATAAGYNLDGPRSGGRTKLAEATGISLSQIQRALSGDVVPDIRSQRQLARALGVSPSEMYLRSGTLEATDLEGVPESVSDLDLRTLGLKLGVAPARMGDFESIVQAVAQTFRSDDSTGQ